MPSISCTTRPARGDRASENVMISSPRPEFDAMSSGGDFLEYARVFGKHSSAPQEWLDEAPGAGAWNLVLEIDVQARRR